MSADLSNSIDIGMVFIFDHRVVGGAVVGAGGVGAVVGPEGGYW